MEKLLGAKQKLANLWLRSQITNVKNFEGPLKISKGTGITYLLESRLTLKMSANLLEYAHSLGKSFSNNCIIRFKKGESI